jgi:hypothetical protein
LKAGKAGMVGGVGAGMYLLADLVPASIQTWAYGSFQQSIHRGVILAALLVAVADGVGSEQAEPAEIVAI